MGSTPSKNSVTLTKVQTLRPASPEEGKRPSVSTALTDICKGGREELNDKEVKEKIAAKKVVSNDGASKSSSKYLLNRNDGKVEADADIIALHRTQPLPPIHYVEKNEGGMLVEDVDAGKLPATDDGIRPRNPDLTKTDDVNHEKDDGNTATSDINDVSKTTCTSVPGIIEYEVLKPIPPRPRNRSLPDNQHRRRTLRQSSRTNPTYLKSGKLGVTARNLLEQLETQGIITSDSTKLADSPSVLGELSQLGLIKECPTGSESSTVYDESGRRKVPVRLCKLGQKDSQSNAFPNPEEKRRRIITRAHPMTRGVQMNEDVVNNAIQRACVRERQSTKSRLQEEDKKADAKELKEKIAAVELL